MKNQRPCEHQKGTEKIGVAVSKPIKKKYLLKEDQQVGMCVQYNVRACVGEGEGNYGFEKRRGLKLQGARH